MNAASRPTLEDRVEVLERGHAHITHQMADVTLSLQEMTRCLEAGTSKMAAVQAELLVNTATTTEVREILHTARSGIKFLGGIGLVIRWLGYMAAAFGAVYAFWHLIAHGMPPSKP